MHTQNYVDLLREMIRRSTVTIPSGAENKRNAVAVVRTYRINL